MANIHSQKKRILRTERERLENRRYTSAIKTHFRSLEALVRAATTQAADAAHRELVSTIDKAVKRGALHRNTGAHKKSRAARLRACVLLAFGDLNDRSRARRACPRRAPRAGVRCDAIDRAPA